MIHFDINRTGKKQEVSLTYDSGNPPRLYADPAYSTTGYEVKPDDTESTFDPLSAVMFIVSGAGAGANPCAVTAPVFDGRRRYDIEMTKVKDVDIKMDNGLYAGNGLLCEVRYHQLAGFKPRVLKDNESFPVINAWVATFPSAVLGGLCGAAAGLGRHQIWRAGDDRQIPESRWRKPQGRTLTDKFWHQAAVKL